jgi:hypothetical protein
MNRQATVDDARRKPKQFTLRQLFLWLAVLAVCLALAAPWLRRLIEHSPLIVASMSALIEFAPFIWIGALAAAVLILAAIVLALGMVPVRCEKTQTAARWEAIAHGVGAVSVLALLLAYVPYAEGIYKQYEMSISTPTIW